MKFICCLTIMLLTGFAVFADAIPLSPQSSIQDASTPAELRALPLVARRGLSNVAYKLARGEEVSVVFIGGSVTEGGGSGGYVAKVGAWLVQQYPQANIKVTNAGVGGTGSEYGWQRLDRDALVYKPDLLIIDFSVNDRGSDASRSMEALVRKTWLHNPQTDIVLLYNTTQDSLPDYAAGRWPEVVSYHEKVARYYDIPIIGTGYAVAAKVNAGEVTWTDLYHDRVHPKPAGYAIYSQAIVDAFKTLLVTGSRTPAVVPATTLTPNLIVEPSPFVPTALPPAEPLVTKEGEKALVTYAVPIAGVHWGNEPEYRVGGEVLWRLSSQSTDVGRKLDATFGLDRKQWKGPMAYFLAGSAFSADQPKASPLAYRSGKGISLGAKEATMGILSFVAPKSGRYVFSVRSKGVTLWSQHKTIALNIVHFPVGQSQGTSVAFNSTTVEVKADLNLEFPIILNKGDEIAFEVDTNASGGGGGAFWDGLEITVGEMGT